MVSKQALISISWIESTLARRKPRVFFGCCGRRQSVPPSAPLAFVLQAATEVLE
jgi:hypothetical protein